MDSIKAGINKQSLLLIVSVVLAFTFYQIPVSGKAQGVIGNAIRNKVEQKVVEKTEESIDDAFDQNTKKKTKGEKNTAKSDNEDQDSQSSQTKNSTPQSKQKLETKTQYDFVPGDNVLFYDDFSQDAIGDFPALWTGSGSGEVKTVNLAPGRWFHMTGEGQVYNLMKDLNLPENFIFEFDLIAQPVDDGGNISFYLSLYNSKDDFLDDLLYPGTSGIHITITNYNWQVRGYHNEKDKMIDGETSLAPISLQEPQHVIVWVQKSRVRMYHKGQKVVDLPSVIYTPANFNRLRFSLWSGEGTPLVSNIRFTTAAPDTRSKLITEGKLISYGIYFDVNSDKIKPESKGAINDIANVLKENPDVRIRIDGHTDSDGDDAKNLDLSKRRSASVKNMLTTDYGIDASRIETNGLGETKPISPNTTSEGKAKNRRVEFIKI